MCVVDVPLPLQNSTILRMWRALPYQLHLRHSIPAIDSYGNVLETTHTMRCIVSNWMHTERFMQLQFMNAEPLFIDSFTFECCVSHLNTILENFFRETWMVGERMRVCVETPRWFSIWQKSNWKLNSPKKKFLLLFVCCETGQWINK